MGTIALIQLILLVLQIALAITSFVMRSKSKSFFDEYDEKADKLLGSSFFCCLIIVLLNLFYLF